MNLAVFFKAFEPAHEAKDPGQIVMGLRSIGIESELFTLDKPTLKDCNISVPIRILTKEQAADSDYWRSTQYDAIIVYTRLDKSNLWMVDVLKKAGEIVIVKADTDGRKIFPVYPRDMMDYTYSNAAEKAKAFYTRLKRRIKGRVRANRLAEHICSADAVIVESPQAFANISYILSYWGRPELARKIFFIPNPVSDNFAIAPIPAKENLIVASGGWDSKIGSSYVKNTTVMVSSLCRFLAIRPDYYAVVIGSGRDIVEKLSKKWKSHENLHITGYIPNNEVAKYVGKAKIIFQPSLYETFGIAVAEGLCMGCSFVGSPLESFYYLSNGGFSGTLPPDFTEEACFAALVADSLKWERKIYSYEAISSYWRPLLNRETIAKKYLELAEQLSHTTSQAVYT